MFVYVSCYGSRSNLCNPEEEKQELKNIEVKMANLGYNSGIHCFLTVTLFHKHKGKSSYDESAITSVKSIKPMTSGAHP